MAAETASLITTSLKASLSERAARPATASTTHQLYMKATGAMASLTAYSP